MIHGGVKGFTEGHKYSTEAPNDSLRGINNSRRGEIIHGGA